MGLGFSACPRGLASLLYTVLRPGHLPAQAHWDAEVPTLGLGSAFVLVACSFFFLKIFLMWTIFKVLIECVTILLLFLYFGFLAARHVGS